MLLYLREVAKERDGGVIGAVAVCVKINRNSAEAMLKDGAWERLNVAETHGFPPERFPRDRCGFDAGADGEVSHQSCSVLSGRSPSTQIHAQA